MPQLEFIESDGTSPIFQTAGPHMPVKPWRIFACASQGTGSTDEARLRDLLQDFDTTLASFDHSRKRRGFLDLLKAISVGNYNLFVVEGTGFAVGAAAILGKLVWRRPYVLSSGDAVAPFLSARIPAASLLFEIYERLLYRQSAGFIGWTPYLVGRALTLGARRAVTVPGWAPSPPRLDELEQFRKTIRTRLGIPEKAVVFGIAGSLLWSKRFSYCYGSELVRAAARSNGNAFVLIVGSGSGLERLKSLAGDYLGKTIFFTGRVRREEVCHYLAAMDVGSLPQTVDQVGSFRYTTKLPEYRSANLLIATNQIPMAYDLDRGDMIRCEGEAPWSENFLNALAKLMSTLTAESITALKGGFSTTTEFNRDTQVRRVTAFLTDLLAVSASATVRQRL